MTLSSMEPAGKILGEWSLGFMDIPKAIHATSAEIYFARNVSMDLVGVIYVRGPTAKIVYRRRGVRFDRVKVRARLALGVSRHHFAGCVSLSVALSAMQYHTKRKGDSRQGTLAGFSIVISVGSLSVMAVMIMTTTLHQLQAHALH